VIGALAEHRLVPLADRADGNQFGFGIDLPERLKSLLWTKIIAFSQRHCDSLRGN
jgi:hypothetical protein